MLWLITPLQYVTFVNYSCYGKSHLFKNLFVVTVVVVLNFTHFHLLLKNLWSISTKLGPKHLWTKGIQVCLNEGADSPFKKRYK